MQTFLSGRGAELTAWGSLRSEEGPCYSVGESPSRHAKSSNHLPSYRFAPTGFLIQRDLPVQMRFLLREREGEDTPCSGDATRQPSMRSVNR